MGKVGNCVNDSGEIVTRIKELVEVMACNTRFKLITKHKKNHLIVILLGI